MTAYSSIRQAATVLAIAAAVLLPAPQARALSLDLYAASSVLAQGRWVKVSVPRSGLYSIPAAKLRQYGFTDPAKVRVYGYGAQRIPDVLAASNYVDDLPETPCVHATDGSVSFYAQGPETWTMPISGRWIASNNIYTNVGYYYLHQPAADAAEALTPTPAGSAGGDNAATSFTERLHHEQDIATPGEAGVLLLGEDFRFKPQQRFSFDMPGRIEETGVWMECSFVARTLAESSRLKFWVNNTSLPESSTDIISPTTSDAKYHGTECVTRPEIPSVTGNKLEVTVQHVSSSPVYGAWLNYLSVNYTRRIALEADNGRALVFSTNSRSVTLDGADASTQVWDVTDARNIRRMETALDNGRATWTNTYGGNRTYAAWRADSQLPQPDYCGEVANQNLHAHGIDNPVPQLVIISPREWISQAERIATLRRSQGLNVAVVEDKAVYNEFGSGSPDVGALRRYLKMLYDRGKGTDSPLQYCLLMARATFDNRHNTPGMANSGPTLPNWGGGTMRQSLNDNDGFTTDDVLAILGDGHGASRGIEPLSIAVGRIPVTSLAQARNYVDKLEQYTLKPRMTAWKNQMLLLADDRDQGEHMRQMDTLASGIERTPLSNYQINKVYMDAYDMSSGCFPGARRDMFQSLNDGVAWWVFIGHANNHSMTHEGQLTYNDIKNFYVKTPPVLYASTCDFLRWDSYTESGGEIMFNERNGGVIAMISATRPVYIYENGLLSAAMGRAMGARDSKGRPLRLGEIYRRAKNDIRNRENELTDSPNRLRYVLMGDPSMTLPMPEYVVRVTDIDGVSPDSPDNSPTLQAMATVTVNGIISDAAGNALTGFNGTVSGVLHDAEYSTTSNGRESDGIKVTFERIGARLATSSTQVKDGAFSMRIAMPAEIANNYRPAALNLYAHGTMEGQQAEASALERRLYVYGEHTPVEADTVAPVIEALYMNHPSFKDSGTVNASPMLIARVSDNVGINLSNAGIGHGMAVIVDGNELHTDVSNAYTPASDGSAAGTIAYSLSSLMPGKHTATLRVWDTSGNVATADVHFNVDEKAVPQIFRLYSDANPAVTQANFYMQCDRPDARSTVTVTVYNLLGQPLWSGSGTGINNMFETTPISWNLCDAAGRPVGRGIYLYRATITCDGETFQTATQRIAVAK